MKILHVIPSITVRSGGPAATLSNMVEIWRLAGIESDVLTIDADTPTYPVRTSVFKMRPSFPGRLSNSCEASEWFRYHSGRYGLIIFHAIWSLINLRLARIARARGMKYIVIPHGSIDPFDLQKKRLLKLLLGPLVIRPYLNGARMILCSTQLESQRIETYGSKTAPYSIPWAVKSEVWDADRETVRRRLGIQSDEFVMIFLGRIDYKKGFPILIPAFSRLVESGRRSTLLIVGPDTRGYTNTVRKLLVSTGVNQHARVLAPVVGREKSELLAASDCFVLPSLNENFAVAVVEAMQHSLPVIISRNVYIHEAISESGAGIVCDYSVDSLFEAMKRIRDDPALRSQFAIAASQAGAKFTPQAMKDRYHELLMRVVNE